MIQSPKSKRSADPWNKSNNDEGSVSEKSHVVPERHTSGSGSPRVPGGLQHSGGKHQGNVKAEAYVPVGSAAPSQAGGPKMNPENRHGKKTGGSEHIT